MSADSLRQSGTLSAARHRFPALFLHSGREIFRTLATWVRNMAGAENFKPLLSRIGFNDQGVRPFSIPSSLVHEWRKELHHPWQAAHILVPENR